MVSKKETIPTPAIESAELRAFLSVAELGSVTRAANRLGVTKSTVSKQLSALEERVGAKLFERTSRRIAITPSGEMLRARARSVLSELEALISDIRELNDEVRGRLNIAAPPDLAALLTQQLFPAFLDKYPELCLSLRLDYGYVDLQDPSLDVAIRIGSVQDDRLVARRVGHVVRVLVASPSFARRARLSSPEQLGEQPALVFSDDVPAANWTLTAGRKRATVAVTGRLCARSFPVLLTAAEAGLGVALVPEFVARAALEQERLVRVLPDWSQHDAAILLVHRVGHTKLRRVTAFLEFARQALEAGILSATRRSRS